MTMEVSTYTSDEEVIVDLTGELNIYAMAAVSKMMPDWLLEPANLVLNLDRMSALDGSGLQALLFVRHARGKRQRETEFRNVPDVVADYLAKAGLDLTGRQRATLADSERSADTQGQNYA